MVKLFNIVVDRNNVFSIVIVAALYLFLIQICVASPSIVNSHQDVTAKINDSFTSNAYGKLPLSFIKNAGQLDNRVKYFERGSGHATYFTSEGVALALFKSSPQLNPVDQPGTIAGIDLISNIPTVVMLKPVGGNQAANIIAESKLPGQINYFLGTSKDNWHVNTPTFQAIRYEGVYAGVDLLFYGNNNELEYDFIVAPQADPRQIEMAYEGVKGLTVNTQGELVVALDDGELIQKRPIIFQESDGKRQYIEGKFRVNNPVQSDDTWTYSFDLAAYDPTRPLIIDPILSYSTYLGGSNHDHGNDIAVNAAGEAFIVGNTLSLDYPVLNAYQSVGTIDYFDVFVTKFNAQGNALVYSTFIGGSNHDFGLGIAVDSNNNAYVTGWTGSDDFPMQGAIQSNMLADHDAGFVFKLNATGSALFYSTYLGGSRDDHASDIAVDSVGNAYVVGNTQSLDFPTVNPLYTVAATGNNKDAFVTKINAGGTAYIYSTYLGGDNADYANGVAVDTSGNAYITGATESDTFPTTASAYMATHAVSFSSAYLSKISANGTQLMYSTYLCGTNDDIGNAVGVDAFENAYVVGMTRSEDFPTVNPLYTSIMTGNNDDVFISRVDTLASGASSLVYSTYLGGDNHDAAFGVAVTFAGDAYITGETRSLNFPVTGSPFQAVSGGDRDGFIAKLNPAGTSLVYASYIGGSNEDMARGIGVDGSGNSYVVGQTRSIDFPTVLPYQALPGSLDFIDTFVLKAQ